MQELTAIFSGPLGYVLLAGLAFGDALIGVSFFIFGELAFLAAGAIYVSTSNPWPIVTVMVAALLSDVASYALGRIYGTRAVLRFLKAHRRRRAWLKAKRALQHHAVLFIAFARILGPLAWVAPFLSGASGIRFRLFLPATSFGVIIGVGQFCVYGALGAKGFDALKPFSSPILKFISDHFGLLLFTSAIALSAYLIVRYTRFFLFDKLMLVAVVTAVVFIGTNLIYFFGSDVHAKPPAPDLSLNICSVLSRPLMAKPGSTSWHAPQPVNVLLITDKPVEELMSDIGWFRNQTYTHNNISLLKYIRLALKNLLPVSELYLWGQPATSAFQMPGNWIERIHIRWWRVAQDSAKNVYLGAISRDHKLAIKYYKAIPALLHSIAPDVDLDRDLLKRQLDQSKLISSTHLPQLAAPVSPDDDREYITDGRLLVSVAKGIKLSARDRRCLGEIN